MPPLRTDTSYRRSRRLSYQEPKNYAESYSEDTWKDRQFTYPSNLDLVNKACSSSLPIEYLQVSPTSLSSNPSPLSISQARRRHKPGHISRPPNAFMIFRSLFWAKEKLKEEPIERDHCDISRIAAHCWNNLDDQAKAPYRALAKQRKTQHGLDHPDYKYQPTYPRERTSKKKGKKRDDEEEERCRKLASLVMDGVSSAGIREAMKGTEKKVHPTRKPHSTPLRQPPSPVEPASAAAGGSLGCSASGKLEKSWEGRGTDLDDTFVPTEEIPYLELPPSVKKEEEDYHIQFDPSIRLPASHEDIDLPFGVKAPMSNTPSRSCFWYTSDSKNTYFEDSGATYSYPLPSEGVSHLESPFPYPITSLSCPDSLWAQETLDVFATKPSTIPDFSYDSYDVTMGHSFYYDYC